MDTHGSHTSRGVAREVMEKTLGRWMPGHSRRNPQIQVHLISNISRGFIPVSRSAVYRGGSWVRRMGRRVGSWVGTGIKLFGGVAVVTMSTVPSHLWANPEGEVVVGGAANFNRPDAATLIVNQQTDRAVINWNSFSIANGELTRFVQPSSTSAALNRVVTSNPSQIYGTLQANGQVYLINPGGVMVGPGGVVDVAGFVASTHDIANEEFMRGGNLNFHGNSEASVLNQGRVEAREGDVFLVAREVKNEGQLMAKDGTVGMVSGTEVSLQAVGQGNFKIRLLAAEDDPTTAGGGRREAGGEAEIVNEGVIQAANAVLEAKGSYLPMAIKNTGLIEATGVRENGDGTVSLTGGEGDILNTGVVAALQRSLDGQKETGGSILMAGKNVTSDPGSIITAAGRDGGGSVKLRATDTTILRGSIEVAGTSESAKGGQVQLLGERVGLFDQAKVDASGGAGGGEVLVGGDYLGRNPEVPNAKATVMVSEAKITADATANGDGGRVILWSDEYTGFYGDISARGGVQGGDGGFVETSSKINLQAFGGVDLAANRGEGGLWLLDPLNVTIITGGSGTLMGGTFTPVAGTTTIAPNTIEAVLGAASVTITTGTTEQEEGNITVANAINDSGTGTLTLNAAGGIFLNAGITFTGGSVSLIAGGTVSQNAALAGDTLTVSAPIIRLANEANQFSTVNLNSREISGAVSEVNTQYRDLNNYTVNISGTPGSGNLQLASDTGTVTLGGGGIDVQGLLLGTSNDTSASTYFALAGGQVPTIAIQTLAAQTSGRIQFNDNNGFSVGTVFGRNGIERIGTASPDVVLISGGDVTQSQKIQADELVVITTGAGGNGAITLDNFENNAYAINLQAISTGNSIAYRDQGNGVAGDNGLIIRRLQSAETIGLRVDSGQVIQQAYPMAFSFTGGSINNPTPPATGLAPAGFAWFTGNPIISLTGGGATTQAIITAGGANLLSGTLNYTILNGEGGAGYTEAPGITMAGSGGDGSITGIGFNQADLALVGDADFDLEMVNVLTGIPLNQVERIGIDMLGNSRIYRYRDVDWLNIASVSGQSISAEGIRGGNTASVTLTVGGGDPGESLRQSSPIDLQSDPTGGGTFIGRVRTDLFYPSLPRRTAIRLEDTGNDVGNLELRVLNFAGTVATTGQIYYTDASGFNILGLETQANAVLQAGAGSDNPRAVVTQTGAIRLGFKEPGQGPVAGYGGLLLLGERGYNLSDGGFTAIAANAAYVGNNPPVVLGQPLGNDIDFLAVNIPGASAAEENRPLTYVDSNPFQIWWVDQDFDGVVDADENRGIQSAGTTTLFARDGNPALAQTAYLSFAPNTGAVALMNQGITVSSVFTTAGYVNGVINSRRLSVTVGDGDTLLNPPVRNTDGVFNQNFGTTITITDDNDSPDVNGMVVSADNIVLNGRITALAGQGVYQEQAVVLQPYTGSSLDRGTATRNVVLGTKSDKPSTTALELLSNELRTVNADTLQVQTASRTTSTGGGTYALAVNAPLELIGTEALGGVGTFRMRAFGDVALGAPIRSGANSTSQTGPLNVSVMAGDGVTAGRVLAQSGITTLNGTIDIAGVDVQITGDLNAGTGLAAIRPTRYFGIDQITVVGAGGGFNPNKAPLVTLEAPGDLRGGEQAQAKAIIGSDPAQATYGQITGIQITDSGSGYINGPARVVISPINAAGVALVEGGAITAIQLTEGGSGYTAAPTVTFIGGGGTGATGTAEIDTTAGSPTFGQVVRIRITNPGSSYEAVPRVVLTGPTQSGTAAVAISRVGGSLPIHLGSEPGTGTGLGLLGSELQRITARTLQIGSFSGDSYPLIGGTLPVGHPFVTGLPTIAAAFAAGQDGILFQVGPTFNTGRIILDDNLTLTSARDLVLIGSEGVRNKAGSPAVADAAGITASGLGIITDAGYDTYGAATVQLYGANNVDRLAVIVPNGSVAFRDVDGFSGGGNFGSTTAGAGAVGGVQVSATSSALGIGVVNAGQLAIISGGPVTIRERAFTQSREATFILQNAAGRLAADLSQASTGDPFFFEAAGAVTVGDLTFGVVSQILPVIGKSDPSSPSADDITYDFVPVVTIDAPTFPGGTVLDPNGVQAAGFAVWNPLLRAVTGIVASGGAGYTSQPNVNVVGQAQAVAVLDTTTGAVTISLANNGVISLATGSGFTTAPTVTVVGLDPTGVAISETVVATIQNNPNLPNFGRIDSIANPALSYGSAPTITITGGGLTAATARINSENQVSGVSLGTSYLQLANSVTIGAPAAGGSQASAVASGGLAGITVAETAGFAAKPVVTITAPGAVTGIDPTGAASAVDAAPLANGVTQRTAQAEAIMGIANTVGVASAFQILSGGEGYSGSPSVVITGGGGKGASAIATVVQSSGGGGYTAAPTANVPATGAGAIFGPVTVSAGRVTDVVITAAGAGYAVGDVVTFTGGVGGAGAQGVVNLISATGGILGVTFNGGVVSALTRVNPGSGYTSIPSISIADASGQGAAVNLVANGLSLLGFAVNDPGAGYQTAPSSALGGGISLDSGPPVTATSSLQTLFTVTARGSGYSAAGGATPPTIVYEDQIPASGLGVGGFAVSGFTGGVNGIVTSSGAVTLSVNDLDITGFLPYETANNGTPLSKIDTSSGGATGAALVTIRPATGTETGAVSANTGEPIKGTPIEIYLGSNALAGSVPLQGLDPTRISLSQVDIDSITAAVLVSIGRNDSPTFAAGQIRSVAPVFFNPLQAAAAALITGADIIDGGSGSLTGISRTAGTGVPFRLGLDAQGSIGLTGSVNNTDILAAEAGTGLGNFRYVEQDGFTVGEAGGLAGILAATAQLEAGGTINQDAAGTIIAPNLSVQTRNLGRVGRLEITGLGSGYTRGEEVADPSIVTFQTAAGPGEVQATGRAVVRGGQVVGVNVTDPGQYSVSQPTVTISAPPTGVQATATTVATSGGRILLDALNGVRVAAMNSNNGSAGSLISFQTTEDLVIGSITAGQPGGAPPAVAGMTARTIIIKAGGNISQDGQAPVNAGSSVAMVVADGKSISLDAEGNIFPAFLSLGAQTSAGLTGQLADLSLRSSGGITLGTVGVTGLQLQAGGAGYTGVPTVSLGGGNGNATAEAVMGLNAVAVTSAGQGYVTAPDVVITGGGGSGAAAVARIDSNPLSATYGQLTAVEVTSLGSGYTSVPTLSLVGGGGSGAALNPTLSVVGLLVTATGSGFSTSTAPTVTFGSNAGGAGAAAVASTAGTGFGVANTLTVRAVGAITQPDGPITAGGAVTLTGSTITLANTQNNLVGTVTATSSGVLTINNNNFLQLGNIRAGGALTLGSTQSIFQNAPGNSITVNGNAAAAFYATATALSGGTPNGAVILNNLGNNFTGSVAATGTRVVIRDSGPLQLGPVTASTSLVANSGGAFTQSGLISVTGTGASAISATGTVTLGNANFGGDLSVISTAAGPGLTTIQQAVGTSMNVAGNSTFTAAGGNSIDVEQANTFTGTVTFAASSGNLANVTVRDTTALDLGALTLGAGGNLKVTAAGITQSGPLVVPGTITLVADGSNITLNNAANNFGTVVITSANNANLRTLGPVILSGPSSLSGDLTLVAGGNITNGAGIAFGVGGLATFSAGASSITLGNGGSTFNFGSLDLTGGVVTVTESSAMVLAGVSATTLNLTATSGITQTGAIQVLGGAATFQSNQNPSSIILGNTGNNLTGNVFFQPNGGGLANVTIFNQSAITTQATGLTISGALALTSLAGITFNNITANSISATAGGNITDVNGTTLNIAGLATFNSGGFNITLGDDPGDTTNFGSLNLTGATVTVTEDSAMVLAGVSATTLNLSATSGITQTGAVTVTGNSTFTANAGQSILLGNSGNNFTGTVEFNAAGLGILDDITLHNNSAYSVQTGGLTIGGDLVVTAAGIGQQGALDVGGTTTLNAGSQDIELWDFPNSYASTLTIGSARDVALFVPAAQSGNLGPVTASGLFAFLGGNNTDINLNGAAAGHFFTSAQLQNFRVGTFGPAAFGTGSVIIGAGGFNYPGIQNLALVAADTGSIQALGPITTGKLSFYSGTTATFSAVNSVSQLGPLSITPGGLSGVLTDLAGGVGAMNVELGGVTFRNNRGLSLNGTVTMPGRLSLEVAGQFYNQTGSAYPLAGVGQGSVIKSLSLAGGLPGRLSTMAGFGVRYDGQMPTSGNVMSYAVSPLTMFAPNGTVIAGVDLSGTQTGGGQLNTFFTGSDNLNWMIADFGKFNLPKVDPARLQYMLYQQRVEPETRSLPQPVMRELTMELGRPPTIEEIQQREVAKRQALQMRSGAILERSSFDEDVEEPKQEAMGPGPILDGGKPQAEAGGQRTEDGGRWSEVGGQLSESLKPQAKKQTDMRRDPNGPVLRSGPRKAVALRAEPVDPDQILQAERERAEVNVAPPVAASPR